MSTIRELHDKAISLSSLAMLAHAKQDFVTSEKLALQALELEKEAAFRLKKDKESEPTRSILFRSAASIAIQCNDFESAKRLIAEGLAGFPPVAVEKELLHLQEDLYMDIHLAENGARIEDNQINCTLIGGAIGYGSVLLSDFLTRIRSLCSLLDRTTQRKMNYPYLGINKIKKEQRIYQPAILEMGRGSVNISIKLISLLKHADNIFVSPGSIIDSTINCIGYVNNDEYDRLRYEIKDEAYYVHFLTMARDIAPDGNRVTSVLLNSENTVLEYKTMKSNIPIININESIEASDRITLEGTLNYAESRRKNKIGITTTDNQDYNIIIKEGMDDYVKNYWNQQVIITGRQTVKGIILEEISLVNNLS